MVKHSIYIYETLEIYKQFKNTNNIILICVIFLIVLKKMGPAWQSQESQKLTINLLRGDKKKSNKLVGRELHYWMMCHAQNSMKWA